MSAPTRCARYARVFNRSLHSYSRNITRSHTEQKKNIFGTHTAQFTIGHNVPKRFNAVTTGESSQVKYDDSQEGKDGFAQHNMQLREQRKDFKFSENYPASTFWKKFDYSQVVKVYDFHSAAKNIFFQIMSQKGINATEFYDFMSLVEQRDQFTDDEVKLILKTVGEDNKEVSIEDKVKWMEYLTCRFISLGLPLDVTYYNSMLSNYLKGNHRFSPVDFMSSMEKQGVAPNSVTLSGFVIAYCKVGDIKSASQTIEHMRSSEMSINSKLYNSLILGNFIAGDKETAMQLLRDTSNMGFSMDASVYHAAIVGHALMGDLDGVKELMNEAKDNFVMLSDRAYSSMIQVVAPKGRKDIIDYLLNELTQTSRYHYNELVDTMQVLMGQGNSEIAFQYFRGLNNPSAKLFYKSALLTNMPKKKKYIYPAESNSNANSRFVWARFRGVPCWWPARVISGDQIYVKCDNALLESYAGKTRDIDEIDQSMVEDLTKVEKYLLKSQYLMKVRGKGNRPVPVLIPADTQKSLDYIASRTARREAGIPEDNLYLFPNSGQSHARAYSSLKNLCDECLLAYPGRITSVSLRKYTATLTQAAEEVVKYSRILKREGVRDASLTEYFSAAIMKYFYEPAIALLPHLQAEGETLRPQFLWPLIQYFKVMEDVEGIKKLVPYIDPSNEVRTITVYLEPAFRDLGVLQQEYKSIFKKYSRFNEGQINACMVHWCLITGGWESAAEYAKSCKGVEDVPSGMTSLIGGRMIRDSGNNNWKHVFEVMVSTTNFTIKDRVIRGILQTGADKEELKQMMLEKGISVNENILPEDFKALFSEEELSKVSQKAVFDEMRNMTYGELQAIGDRLGNNFVYKICLLDKSYKEQKWDTYKRTLESVDLSRVTNLPIVIAQSAWFYSKQGNLQMALHAFDLLHRKFPNFVPNRDAIWKVSQTLCKEGRHDDAVRLLARYNYNDKPDYIRDSMLIYDYKSVFEMEPTQENIKIANQLLETLSSNGYIRLTRNILVHYWNFISSCGDVNAVLEAIEVLKIKYKFIPHDYAVVLGHFLKNNDKGSLLTAFDKITDVVPEQKVMLSLAAGFVENRQPEKAKKVLATPGMRLMTDTFKGISQRWASNGQINLIEEFTQLVSNLPGGIDKAEMVSLNLRAMCNKEEPDVDACIRYFETKFDEEEVKADVNTLRIYTKFLSRHNREVPFDNFTMDLIKESNRRPSYAQVKKEPEQKKTETEHEKPEKEIKQNVTDGNRDLVQLLKQRSFPSAVKVCKKLSPDEIRKSLPNDAKLLADWARFLVNRYNAQLLETLPEEIQEQLINVLFDSLGEEKPDLFVEHFRYLLDKHPDRLLSCIPKMNIVYQTALFTASLFNKDGARSKSILEMMDTRTGSKFVHAVVMKMQTSYMNQELGKEQCFILIDSMEAENDKAFAFSYTLAHFVHKKDYEAIGLLAEKANSCGLTFEKVANLLTEKARQIFITKIGKVEETLKSENKSVQWEPSSNWRIEEKQAERSETKGESTEITTEKATTDLATEVDDHTELAVPKENPAEKTEIFTVKKESEDIVDIAKTVSDATEPEMKDKATVISDDSSELGSKSESTKEKS